jgi:UDP-hydrolysing UDP-N-acetyl-D-glucosamine 2-epimerase
MRYEEGRPAAGDAAPAVKIVVLTSGRSDFGLIRPLLKRFSSEPAVETTLACLGPASDLTDSYVSQGGIAPFEIARFPLDGRAQLARPTDAAVFLSNICVQFAAWLSDREPPDWVVAPGDRFEVYGAVLAAYYGGAPIAHVFAGDRSQGGHLDDSVRHAITKLAHLHFAVCPDSFQRVLALGEEPWRVHEVGSPVVESIHEVLADREPLDRLIAPRRFNVLGTYHPISSEPEQAEIQLDALLAACDRVASQVDAAFIFTHPNFEFGSQQIIERLKRLAGRPHYFVFEELGWKRYLQTLSQCDLAVGNSSSLLLEAPILGVPSLAVGTRQKGRCSPAGVKHIEEYDPVSIADAMLAQLLAPRANVAHPYGPGNTSSRILEILARTLAERTHAELVRKQITY